MRQELLQLEKVLQLLQKTVDILKAAENPDDRIITEILNGVTEVNIEVYGCEELSDFPLNKYADVPGLFQECFDRWMNRMVDQLQLRKLLFNKTDYDFQILSAHITVMSEEGLLKEAVACLEQVRQDCEQNYEYIKNIYNNYHYFWGSLDLDRGDIGLLKSRVHEIKSHWDDLCWLYQNLADYRSKKVLYGILHYWLTFDFADKNTIVENNYDDYYDFDILTCSEDEVFVDLGAYNGDSALSYIENFGSYKRIYCYEMASSAMKEMEQKLAAFDHIVYRQAAVGNRNESAFMTEINGATTNFIVSPQEVDIEKRIQVPMVKLDDDICEPITFLKMDIEGSELEAMKGAEQHIRKDKPKLAVCSYHNNHHIYEIPRLMREYNPQYKLYMRYNGPVNHVLTSEYVTFALP